MDSKGKRKNSSQGVYTAVRPTVRITDQDLYVPRFLSGGFFTFLADFCRNPFENPVFLKEWRRHKRRLGPFEKHWKLVFLLCALMFMFLGFPMMILVELIEDIDLQQVVFMGLYLGPAFIGGTLAFLMGLSGGALLKDRSMLNELRLTPLTIPEVVFGQIIGSVLPFSLMVLAMVPGLAVVMLNTTVIRPVSGLFDPILGISIVLWVVPNTASTMIYCAAISSAVSYETRNPAFAMTKAGGVWFIITLPCLYLTLVLGTVTLVNSFSLPGGGYGPMGPVFVSQEVVIIIYKIAVACGFLQHLSQKLANLQALEQKEIGIFS